MHYVLVSHGDENLRIEVSEQKSCFHSLIVLPGKLILGPSKMAPYECAPLGVLTVNPFYQFILFLNIPIVLFY